MKKKKKIIIQTLIIILTFFIYIPQITQAYFDTSQVSVDTKPDSSMLDIIEPFTNRLFMIGSFASVVALIILGIKYMTSSLEDKAEFKQRMGPYVLGAAFAFGVFAILGLIQEVGENITNVNTLEQAGQRVVTVLSTIGSFLSVILLVALGIKYLSLGTIDEKIQFRKSSMPYIIGAVLVFAASSVASIIYSIVLTAGKDATIKISYYSINKFM